MGSIFIMQLYTEWQNFHFKKLHSTSHQNPTGNMVKKTGLASLLAILVSISINILRAAFPPVGPKAQKFTADLTVFFEHLGSAREKAAHKMLMQLTPGVNFINVL